MKPLILYFTADYPSTEILKSFLEAVDPDVVKYVEIGIPESNPLYDGPTIKATHSLALKNYKPNHLAEYTGILGRKGIPAFALSYYEKFNKLGSGYATFLKDAGFSGVIIPDLLTDYSEESDRIIPKIEEIFSFIPFFNPATPDGLINAVSSLTGSWIYYGLQPSTGIDIPFDLEEVSRRILDLLPGREINFGFGIRTTGQIGEILSLGSSGVAIGSLLVQYLNDKDLEGFRKFQESVKEVCASAE